MRTLAPLALAAAVSAAPVSAQTTERFVGDLAFTPDACMAKRECILKNALTFTDDDKVVWRADAGDLTDGASIPDWAQGLVGGPWDLSYLKAAVLHDHYCARHVRSWRDTHLMFYNALIALGVSEFKAKLMYYAVYLGGPRWIDVLAPVDCDGRSAGACVKDGALAVVDTVKRDAQFDRMDIHAEMRMAEDFIRAKPQASLSDLEKMAQDRHPDDMFYRFGGGVLADVATKRGVR